MPRALRAPARKTAARRATAAPALLPTASLATLAEWAPGQPLRVALEPGGEVVQAESTVALSGAALRALIEQRARVLVTFVGGDQARPVVIGVLQALPETIEVELPLSVPDHAHVDGRRVTLTGRDELELSCGQASITLRRNGRLVIRGTAVESSSSGVNRIKGGTVRIN